MKKIYYFFFPVLIALILLSLISCSKKEEVFEVDIDTVSEYVIVRADNPSSEIKQACTEVWKAIRKHSGIELTVINESELTGDEKTIIIGRTSLSDGIQYSKNVKSDDIAFGVAGESLVVVGGNDELTLESASRYYEYLTSQEESSPIFGSGLDIRENGYYGIDTIKINETDIEDYVIVYDENILISKNIAEGLRDRIRYDSGYILRCDTVPEENRPQIIINVTEKSENNDGYSVVVSENEIEFSSSSSAGLAYACGILTDRFENADTKDIDFLIENETGNAIGYEEITVMTFNIYELEHEERRMKAVAATILKYLPDSVGLQEVDEEWTEFLDSALGEYYVSFHGESDEMHDRQPIYYLRDKWTLVEGTSKWLSPTPEVPMTRVSGAGGYRNLDTVLLERKSDGYRYYHINTHFDPDRNGATVRLRQAEAVILEADSLLYYPKVFTGDLNSTISEKCHSFMNENSFYSSLYLAENVISSGSTWYGNYKEPKQSWENGDGAIDFIYQRAPVWQTESYEVIRDIVYGWYPSDHFPLLVKVIPIKQ